VRTTDRVPYAALVRARFLLPDQSLSGCDMKSFALLTRLLKSRNELPGGIPDLKYQGIVVEAHPMALP